MTLPAELLEWHGRPDVALVVVTLAVVYTRGWARLRRQGHQSLATGWRLVAYLAGMVSITVALFSPVAHLAHVLFTAHMIQHQLLLMVAPPCLLLGNPLPFILWGTPLTLRRRLAPALTAGSTFRRGLGLVTWLPVAGLLYTANLWLWHHPLAYEAALRSDPIHDVEHLAFFGSAILFWWPLVNPAPRRRWPSGGLYYGARIAYLILATAQNTLLGAIIGLTERVLYPSYAQGGKPFGWTAIDDQAFGGGIMWSGSHMYLIAILILLWQAMESEGRRGELRPLDVVATRDRVGR
jgi:putative membrane protein